ncbi:response regulator transcription factor [Acanthopleuribacter pedis]|uniref:Response regulator transcription factor n=1 Tax=Acanthopleuribacter pedis TaxID=442870 RepID=A0A8J7QJR6_9BACT|nr:response regulator transcription factor [Acanthopleuribacter pedis]MBO1319480.1 response regulator transcription factor [Acanthopleuribacter pedis]
MKQHILLIEDEPGLALTLSDRLEAEGYQVTHLADGVRGEAAARDAGPFDLILLDLMLPGKSGFEVCRDLRAAGTDTPILMLTARDQLTDKVVGLKLGADDYLTKPFETAELLARMEALTRRHQRGAPGTAAVPKRDRFGDVEVDRREVVIRKAGEVVLLSARLYQLLLYFIDHPKELLTREHLLDAVWGFDAEVATRTVDVHLSWLRQKLETDPRRPRHFITVYGIGYKFIP